MAMITSSPRRPLEGAGLLDGMGARSAVPEGAAPWLSMDGARSVIEDLVAGARTLAGGLDPDRLAPLDAGRLVEELSWLSNVVEAVRARCARRATVGLVHLREGHRSPAAWLAEKSGKSVAEAVRSLSAAEVAEQSSAVAEALTAGELSTEKVASLAEALREEPEADSELVAEARRESLRGLKSSLAARRERRWSEEDLAARHEALRRGRFLRTWTAEDGSLRGAFALAPADAAGLLGRLEVERDRRFERARQAGDREPLEAYAADALCALGEASALDEAGGAARPKARVLLRVDLPALVRGHREGDEVCEIAGVGTVPLATARELLSDSVVDLVLRDGVDVRSVTGLGRTIPTAVRTALMDRDPTCVVPGCGATQRLEIDHWRVDFARGGPTELDNLARLCRFHHRLKTHRGWRLLGGPGRWQWQRGGP